MKTPLQMIEDIAAEIIENTSLLESIYRNSGDFGETDNHIACLIRSLHKTADKANEYAELLCPPPPMQSGVASKDIADDIFDAVIIAKKLEELAHIYSENYFTDKDNDNPKCHMAGIIYDYTKKLCNELKDIESKNS